MKILSNMHIRALLTGALVLTAGVASGADEEKAEGWSVSEPAMTGESKDVQINVSSGTWMSLDVSPDGKTIAFDMLGDIYVMPIGGGAATAIASGVQWDMQPRFSPDGSSIAFTSDRAGGDNIWVMNADGSDPRQITKEDFRLLNNPTWSPDGKWIAARKHFTTSRSLGTGEIWLYHADGGSGVQVVKRPNEAFQKELGEPIFSPDGSQIYYTMDVTSGNTFEYAQDIHKEIFNIRAVDLATGDISKVAGGPGGAVRATPSPDGKKLAFVRRVMAKSMLFIRDLNTGHETMVYDDLDTDMQEAWAVQGVYPNMDFAPDGQTLYFYARGKIRKLDVVSSEAAIVPFAVNDTRTVFAAPRFTVDVAPDQFQTKMVRWATQSPTSDAVVFESLGKLWIKTSADTAAKRLTRDRNDYFEGYPAWAPDGRTIYFTTWNDQTLGEVRSVSAPGGKSRRLSQIAGHYGALAVSNDGKTLVVSRVSGGRLTTPVGAAETGLFSMSAKGGELALISKSGADPQFVSKSDRLFVRQGPNLVSMTMDGLDERPVATSEFSSNIRISPKGDHVAWIENYHVRVAALPKSGQPLKLVRTGGSVPIKKLTFAGGLFLGWADGGDAVTWSLGPVMKKVALKDAYGDDFTAPETGLDLSMTVDADKPKGITALIGATIITMNGASEVIDNGVVLIDGNRIISVGAMGDVTIPEGAKTIDVSGKTIMPGLIDAHAHGGFGAGLTIPQQSWQSYATVGLGVTTIHDPSNRASTIFAAAEYARAGKIIAPRIFSTGEIVYGAKASFWAPVDNLDDALAHIRRLKAQGAVSVKNYNQPRRDQRQQVTEAARQEGMMVVAEGGSLYHMDMNLVVDGQTAIEHTLPNMDIYDDVLQLWSATNVGYTPTLNVGYGGMNGEDYWYQESDVWKHPLLSKYVPPRTLQARSVRRLTAPDADFGQFKNAALAKKLADKGVAVSIGAHGQREGLGSHWEIWSFAQGGMAPMQALSTATTEPARNLGMSADIGSLETGKLADLLILSANPLDDIRNTDDIEHVMLNGRLYEAGTMNEVATGNRKTKPFYWWGKPESEVR